MLAVYLCPRDGHTQRLLVAGPTVTIGSDPGCTICLADLAPVACELSVLAAGVTIADRFRAGARVGGGLVWPLKVRSLYEDDTVYLGDRYSFRFERLEHAPDAREDALLAAIITGDDAAAREVYADWLEENGDLRRAEFLRLQELPFEEHGERLRELARLTDVAWRARVARRPITCALVARNLGAEPCAGRWELLAESDDPEVRTCELCRAEYQYCLARADVAPRRYPVFDYAALSVRSDIEPWPADEVTPVRAYGARPPPFGNPPPPRDDPDGAA